jgi:formylglycine-generating enzyme required for sulfatase activity
MAWKDPVSGIEFVYVPGGTFEMGDVIGGGFGHEKPVHKVTVLNFYIAKYPVTQRQYYSVMKENPSHFKKGNEYPVENVTWNEAKAFIKKLNEKTGGEIGFRLPSEAEWEYAARSGGKREKYCGGDDIDKLAWYKDNSGGSTHPVGEKEPNGLGIYDMSGNVWEWCADWYGDYPLGSVTDPTGPSGGSLRVLRGGSWNSFAQSCRSAARNGFSPDSRGLEHVGFRLACPSGQ